MGRKRAIFPIALLCSLCLHAIGMNLYVKYGSFLIQPIGRPADARSKELVVSIDPRMLDFGEADGTAIGSNSSPGDEPLKAREADEDQALLSREPVGSGKIAGQAAGASAPTGGGMPTALMTPADPVVPREKIPPTPTPPPAPPAAAVKQVSSPEPVPTVQVSDAELDPKPRMTEKRPEKASPQPQRVQVAVALPAPAEEPRPGVPSSAGLPLPPSDSDSDPFARISGAVTFRNGRLEAQRGRKVKTVRPQIGIAGEMDAMGMPTAIVVLEVHINTEGNVTEVEISKKSGSAVIDERTRDAVYHWTFEPTRDKSGKPIRDVVYFAIEYR